MEIQTLEQTSIKELLGCFNAAFSDYMVPLNLTEQQLENKFRKENIDLGISVGAFESGQLTGFILHGIQEQNGTIAAYNAGTGVLPSARGNRMTFRLYDAVLPLLMSKKVTEIHLEVITANVPAIKAYSRIGFEITRQLCCFKGMVKTGNGIIMHDIRTLKSIDWNDVVLFQSWQPSWQQSNHAVERITDQVMFVGCFTAEKITGYICYEPGAQRIIQIAVHPAYRRQGIGTALLNFLCRKYSSGLSVINVDSAAQDLLLFLKKNGMQEFIRQYDMTYRLINL